MEFLLKGQGGIKLQFVFTLRPVFSLEVSQLLLFFYNFDEQLSHNFHRFLFYAHVSIHQGRILQILTITKGVQCHFKEMLDMTCTWLELIDFLLDLNWTKITRDLN